MCLHFDGRIHGPTPLSTWLVRRGLVWGNAMTDPGLASASSLHRDLADHFALVGAELTSVRDLQSAFALIALRGLQTVAGAEHAGITVLRRGEFDTPSATSDLPPLVDAIQYELGTGPCVDALLDDTVYRTGDLETDPRWPEFGKRAVADTGVRSMLAVRLYCDEPDLQAALNLYADEPRRVRRELRPGRHRPGHSCLARADGRRRAGNRS